MYIYSWHLVTTRTIVFLDDDTPTPLKVVLHFRRTKWEKFPGGLTPVLRFKLIKL